MLKETVQRDNSEGNTMLICYHPPIFSAFKRLVPNSWKDKLLLRYVFDVSILGNTEW